AASPSGLTVGIHLPQELLLDAGALAQSTVRDTTVALPPGVTVNAGGADGLEACSEAQIGYLGHETVGEAASEAFSATLPRLFCPQASKLGTVKITTPLLPNPLNGAVYLASPAPMGEAGQNPFRTLLSLYIVAEDPVSGTIVKLPGEVALNQTTGQVVSTFEDTPQLPFEDLTLHFFGGPRAPLATPGLCGSYTTTASFTPWSGGEAVAAGSAFEIASGPNGSPCPSDPRPFTPEFTAGTTNIQAGAYSELRTTMGHPDADQPLGRLAITLPPGLMGSLSGVTLCGEPQAAEGTCGANSLIGHTIVTAGLGATPTVVARPGDVYLTGPYDGAPFGLSIANPAETGPFDLERGTSCDCVVVRARVQVDPTTARLSVISDPLPTMLQGVPLNLQHVTVQIDRPQFTFNPTSCNPMKIEGTMSGGEGGATPISEPLQVANCARLGFKPGFAVATSSHTSRSDGASLDVKLSYPRAQFGTQANIARVKVELPKQLPSRLTTLQKACTDAVFNANPANCPAASRIGEATATTPLVPIPLTGPAYFVSHGGAKFPELIIVLSGYGITVDLHGETFISKAGITSSTFSSVPDVPVSSFELKLPEGPYSALAANGDLCASKLVMPTTLTAQNGAVIKQNTSIAVTGCTPTIRVIRHTVSGKHATVVVSVPSAGRLVADGGGVLPKARMVSKVGIVTMTLRLSSSEQRFLAHHRGRRLEVPIQLSFSPSHGRRLSARVAVLMR
ncbi:MAG: hypothetical protein FWD42_08125, partial [Solirubrobacterales bacterium]|nr:hypothetical protein [Solirubrobacterales bacterium]